MDGLLHMVQRGGAWAGCGLTQSPPHCTKCNSPPINGQCTKLQWLNILTGGPWTNYIKDPIPHFEFTEEFIIIKVLT